MKPFFVKQFKEYTGVVGQKTSSKTHHIAYLDYTDVMTFLKENYNYFQGHPHKVSNIEVLGHKVTINSLKLRTFAHFDEQNKHQCANPHCGLKPSYFALDIPPSNKKTHYSVAYLSLYGLDQEGNEIEFTHDHTLARCFGGANTLANTTMMCFPCNNQKSRLESRMHHKTLKIIKEYLEDMTGEEVQPQMVLERIKDLNVLPEKEEKVKFIREGLLSLSEVLPVLRDSRKTYHSWFGKKIKTSGIRLQAFAQNDIPCCQNPDCGLPATYFSIERLSNKTFYPDHGYHLNLYGKNLKGEDVQFMHHHILKPGKDGIPEAFAIATLCEDCKKEAMLKDQKIMSKILISMGGVSKDDVEKNKPLIHVSRDQLETMGESKKTVKILETARSLAKYHKCSLEDFIRLCNQKGREENLSSHIDGRQNALMHVVRTLNPITPEGARWFRKEQKNKYGYSSHSSEWSSDYTHLIQQTPYNQIKQRRLQKQIEALAHYYQMSISDYKAYCSQKAQEYHLDNILLPSMNTLRQTCSILNISPQASRWFLLECGHILQVGPERPEGVVETPSNQLMEHVNRMLHQQKISQVGLKK